MAESLPDELNFSIKMGEYKIVKSGSIILSDKDTSVEFSLYDITIELSFEEDNSIKDEYPVRSEDINDRHIKLICTNWNNALGTGLPSPIPIFITDNNEEISRGCPS